MSEISNRKADHLRLAAAPEAVSPATASFDDVVLLHDALPEVDLADVDPSVELLGRRLRLPLVIASMTGGFARGGEVNAILAEASAVPRLVRHDELDWHIHAVSLEAPLAERILVEAAMALVDVIRADETRRLQHCAADDCTGVYLDLSKNASRRYCSTRCGNRMAVRAYRARAGDGVAS